MTSIDITLSNTVSTAVGVQILAGLITKQTKALPGYVGISYLMQVISVENGLKVFELPASHGYNQYDTFFVAEVEFIVANVNGAQVTTTQPYNGESVVGASPTLYLFDNKLRTTEDLTTLVKNGDDLWLRSGSADMVKYTVTGTDPRYLKVSGSFTSSITRERAYHVANGQKWNLVFRSYHGNLGTIDAVPAFDWRGTEARIGTRNPKSVSPNVVNIAWTVSVSRRCVTEVVQGFADLAIGDFTHEVQEVFTDDVSPVTGMFTLMFNGKTTGPINVDASSLEMQAALQQTTTLYSIKVTKTIRNSALNTAIWSVTFAYLRGEEMVGAGNIFTMTVASTSLTGTNPTVNVANKITGSDPFRFSLTSLRSGVKYYAHVMAYNADGFGSATSPLSSAVTCGQPQPPQSVTAAVVDGTTLAVQWSSSAVNGEWCNVDKYKVEWYRAEGTQEQQTITTSAGKGLPEIQRLVNFADSRTLSGYFKLSFGGEMTENLRWNAEAVGLKSVKECLERLSTIGTVDVSREESTRVSSKAQALEYLLCELCPAPSLPYIVSKMKLLELLVRSYYRGNYVM
ncbi:hypothetical protein BBO99_00009440 [Phytophthora kernoviae]|uniref:Fibronectin type-III domain-containing protein n=3 Tax=Phytophthora kernoviae TaxID=325452 RepID=A0A3R7HR42_9STRA|nr:hypothetical protein JM18_009348 [Phytophthora kernoviae]RLN73388.1 hypothetical protein BBO99_00009440 [Phytophthora kernoviae]